MSVGPSLVTGPGTTFLLVLCHHALLVLVISIFCNSPNLWFNQWLTHNTVKDATCWKGHWTSQRANFKEFKWIDSLEWAQASKLANGTSHGVIMFTWASDGTNLVVFPKKYAVYIQTVVNINRFMSLTRWQSRNSEAGQHPNLDSSLQSRSTRTSWDIHTPKHHTRPMNKLWQTLMRNEPLPATWHTLTPFS